MNVEIIDQQINKDRHGVRFESYEDTEGHALKYVIVSDAYDFQSKAIAYRFDGSKWHPVYSISYKEMKTPHKLTYSSDATNFKHFKEDYERLQKMAQKIVVR